jgi:hypothetical protein
LIATRSTECKGSFGSSRRENTPNVVRVVTACSDSGKVDEVYQLVVSRRSGGFYLYGFFSLQGGGLNDPSPDEISATLTKTISR